jgi:multidrug efflux pump subunit AcrB/acyl-coenzyme A thioesterase PaaI-like protein
MSGLTRFSLKNTVAVIILCLMVMGAGVYSATRISVETFPDVTLPAIFVQTTYPGASTEEMESTVTTPLEQQLLPLAGIDEVTSTTAEYSSGIFLLYPFGTDMDEAISEVESAIDKVDLPEAATTIVTRISPNAFPILEVAVTAEAKQSEQLQRLLEQEVVPAIQQVVGVTSIDMQGGTESEIRIELDEQKVAAAGLSLTAVREAIRSKDVAYPLGIVNSEGLTIPVRLSGSIDSIDELRNISLTVMSMDGTGTPSQVKLTDIADVAVVTDTQVIARYNGESAFLIAVNKEQDANTAEVADAVKLVLDEFAASDGLTYSTFSDQGAEVKKSVSTLLKEGGYGILFTIIVIFVFLRNFRATLIAILSLPLSILLTISILDFTGNTLNIMTLGGLAVAIGRIVDDSIVIIENIYRWRQLHGASMKGRELAYHATREVLGPVASSTVATVVVFLPLAFVSGIIGQFFTPFAIAVVSSILASLLVAVTLIPVLGNHFFRKVRQHGKEPWLVRLYEPVLRGALRRKAVVFVLSILLLGGSVGLIPWLGVSFLPAGGDVYVRVKVDLPSDRNLSQTDALARQIEAYLVDQTEIEQMYLRIGIPDPTDPDVQGPSDDLASFMLVLRDGVDVSPFQQRMTSELTELGQALVPEAKVSVTEVQMQGPPTGSNVDVVLYSDDNLVLAEAASMVEEYMLDNRELKNVTNQLSEVQPKWVVQLKDAGEQTGVQPIAVLAAVSERLRPSEVGFYRWDDAEWKVSIAYEPLVNRLEQLEEIPVMTPLGPRKLAEIATIQVTEAPVVIQHEAGRMNAIVSGDIISANTAEVSAAIEADVLSLPLPEGVEVKLGGGFEMIFEGFSDLGIAMAAAVGLVFLVLSVTFGGILVPFVILTSLAFVPIGAFTGLLVADQTLSMSAMIGLLMLIGIVVTNAVVLLQRIEENRRQAIPLHDAIIEAAKTRLRPILMTALATIFALLPLALSQSTSGLISKGLAVTVIGGLSTSTLLTLIFVPALYAAIGRLRRIEPVVSVASVANEQQPVAEKSVRLVNIEAADFSEELSDIQAVGVPTESKNRQEVVDEQPIQVPQAPVQASPPQMPQSDSLAGQAKQSLSQRSLAFSSDAVGFAEFMGIQVESMSEFSVVVSLRTTSTHWDDEGQIHDAVSSALLLHAMKLCAGLSGFSDPKFANMNVQYVTRLTGKKWLAEATLVSRTNGHIALHAIVKDETGETGAVGSGSVKIV